MDIIKDFLGRTDGFKSEGKGNHLYLKEEVQVRFIDDESWEISLDNGEKWHPGKYPSGLNTILNHKYTNTKKKGKKNVPLR